MKRYWATSVLIFVAAANINLSWSSDAEKPAISALLDTSNKNQLVLVAFPDQAIKRVETSPASTFYRRRGTYQSSSWSQRITSQIAEDYHLIKVTEWPMTEISAHCVVYQVPPNQQVPEAVLQLAKDSRVSIAQPMNNFKTQAIQGEDPYSKLQANLQQMQISNAHTITTGKAITIVMIDTGVDLEHPDLQGQISKDENFASLISSNFSTDKHGTAVAGVMVARKNNNIGITGIAPDAKLIAYKACWPNQKDSMDAVCNSFTLALAVNSAIKSNAQILNMSLTGPQDPLLELLLNKAIEKGMIVIAANSKPSEQDSGNFPASMQNVIAVQSSPKTGTNHDISDKKISAPGEKILTTLPFGTYDFISGSSISAAEVSGIVALLMEIKPSLTLAETKVFLERSQIIAKNHNLEGINANTAILALCETTPCPEEAVALAQKELR
jgi:subtilisin family serine protease